MKIPTRHHTSARPDYYRVNDFKVGETLEIFKKDFKIVGASSSTVRYARDHPEIFDADTLESYERQQTGQSNEEGREKNGDEEEEKEGEADEGGERAGLPYANEALILAPYPDAWHTEYKMNFARKTKL
jgi:hypothetical protein